MLLNNQYFSVTDSVKRRCTNNTRVIRRLSWIPNCDSDHQTFWIVWGTTFSCAASESQSKCFPVTTTLKEQHEEQAGNVVRENNDRDFNFRIVIRRIVGFLHLKYFHLRYFFFSFTPFSQNWKPPNFYVQHSHCSWQIRTKCHPKVRTSFLTVKSTNTFFTSVKAVQLRPVCNIIFLVCLSIFLIWFLELWRYQTVCVKLNFFACIWIKIAIGNIFTGSIVE